MQLLHTPDCNAYSRKAPAKATHLRRQDALPPGAKSRALRTPESHLYWRRGFICGEVQLFCPVGPAVHTTFFDRRDAMTSDRERATPCTLQPMHTASRRLGAS